jgi:hypothetical protein
MEEGSILLALFYEFKTYVVGAQAQYPNVQYYQVMNNLRKYFLG